MSRDGEQQIDPKPDASVSRPSDASSTADGAFDATTTDVDARTDLDASMVADADAPASDDAGPTSNDAAVSDGSVDAELPDTGPPMNGGLQCEGTFCAFATDPAKPCCTAQSDVDGRAARAVGRCGLDLRALQSPDYGEYCWQRDQLGIIDDACPSHGLPDEPGCCADDGTCGTLNADQSLGCRHALSSDATACGMPPADKTCDGTGSFGIRISVDVVWSGLQGSLAALTDAGRGKVEYFVLLNVDEIDDTKSLKGRARVCGVNLPPFYSSTLCESYQPRFPNRIWDSDVVPRINLQGRYECGNNGCVLSVEPVTYLLGYEMSNPEAPWPNAQQTMSLRCPSGMGSNCFPDHDKDGAPGVLLSMLNEGTDHQGSGCTERGYQIRSVPLRESIAAIFDGVRRADRLLLGVRVKAGGSVRLGDDCDAARGSAVAEYINSRATGCLLEEGSADFPSANTAGPNDRCVARETQFVDDTLPVYNILQAGQTPARTLNVIDRSPSAGPRVSVVRLGKSTDDVNCPAVRDASY